ncbi:hypothetical protein CesoFtcFv8_006993 [Champsocephalus esox]|uniref:Uncharacterized protein n=1 Tax=Champsocephalus esox TaxID=159716 RepID=A0AAN8CCK0_9TELE|nr:hypothetical protein CesoFtcFv8_006993 [Champsocephalus esox]
MPSVVQRVEGLGWVEHRIMPQAFHGRAKASSMRSTNEITTNGRRADDGTNPQKNNAIGRTQRQHNESPAKLQLASNNSTPCHLTRCPYVKRPDT